MDITNLHSYLLFGYFMNYENHDIAIDLTAIDRKKYRSWDSDSIYKKAANLYKAAVHKNFESNKKHCLPLSGGLDSRAILAVLLECTSAENIYTVTYGQPKSYDYEIGNALARKIGTKHTSYNLSDYDFTLPEMIETSRRMDHQISLFMHPSLWELDKEFSDHIFWSGFFGGRVSGSLEFEKPSSSLGEAKQKYVKKNILTQSYTFGENEMCNIETLIDETGLDNSQITYDEQLDFHNRQRKYTAISNFYKGYTYKKPFIDHDLLTFMLSLPEQFRDDQFLYKHVFTTEYPGIFNFKSKTTQGLPVNANSKLIYLSYLRNKVKEKINKQWTLFFDKNINYVNFAVKMRDEGSLKKLLHSSLLELHERKICPEIPIMKLWEEHQSGKCNHAYAVLILASLEIHLKAGKVLS